MRAASIVLALGLLVWGAAAQAGSGILVNRVELSEEIVQQLVAAYGARVPSGRYWYDSATGVWGVEGGPPVGRMHAGLPLGGRLRSDASGSRTGVWVNGRQIHPVEYVYLQSIFGTVLPGRYWVNAVGVGGFEGMAPSFDLRRAAAPSGGRRESLLGGYFLTGISVLGN